MHSKTIVETSSDETPINEDKLGTLLGVFGTAALCVALTYLLPVLHPWRPWLPGDPLPVVSRLLPQDTPRVVEDAHGDLVPVVPDVVPTIDTPVIDMPLAEAGPVGETNAGVLPPRPPGVATPLEDTNFRGMDRFYRALSAAEAGQGIARAIQYGDSTIAADGITSTVRSRLQARFGNGGPGFIPAGMSPSWNMRKDITLSRQGSWDTASLLLGGGGGRYGLGGIVSKASSGAYLVIHAPKDAAGQPVPLHHLEVWYQQNASSGSWWASVDSRGVGEGSAVAGSTTDTRHSVDVPEGFVKAAFGATGGPVTFYGAVLETKGPGVTWEALGVVGVGSKSFTYFNQAHIAGQSSQRNPDLVVLMIGGNEAGYPILRQGDGSGYLPYYQTALRTLRAGAPQSSCLLISPLDQGTREEGSAPRSKPSMKNLVAVQRMAAQAEGCAFWDARAAMGGEGSIIRWSAMRPPMAWADLLHLSGAGLDLIGNLLADAIEAGFSDWKAAGGAQRPVPTPPGPATP